MSIAWSCRLWDWLFCFERESGHPEQSDSVPFLSQCMGSSYLHLPWHTYHINFNGPSWAPGALFTKGLSQFSFMDFPACSLAITDPT